MGVIDDIRAERERRAQAQTADVLGQIRAERQRRQQAATPDRELVATTGDGGRIYKMGSGQLAYTSDGYATSDQETIAQLMEGATPVEIVQQDFDQQRIDANPGRAVLNEVARGVPFIGSYTDEIIGATNPQAGENLRALSGAMRRERPKTTAAANVTGAIAGAVPAAVAAGPSLAAAAPATLGGKALAGAGLGALVGGTEGAVYGGGLSADEGPTDSRSGNAVRTGATGAGFGLITGAAAPYVGAGLRRAFQRLRGSDVRTIARELNTTPEAATVIRDAVNSGSYDDAARALQRGGPDAMLADATDRSRQLLDTAAVMPSNAGQIARGAVTERVTRGTHKMTDALDDVFGAPKQVGDLVDEIRTGTSAGRSATYDAAYAAPIDYASGNGRAIEQLLNRVPDSAIRRANELMRIRGEQSAQIMAQIADDGTVTFQRMPDVRQLDYITRALRDVASESDGAGRLGGQTAMGSSIEGLARNIRNQMRAAVPEYGAALDAGADAIGRRNAVENGYDFLRSSTTRGQAAEMIASAGESEASKQALREGVRSYIDDVTANVSRTMTDPNIDAREGMKILRDLSSRSSREKLRALLGSEADTLLSQVDEAATGYELRAAIARNSQTAARQANAESIGAVTDQGILGQLTRGEAVDSAKMVVQGITGNTVEAQAVRDAGLYEDIARVLVETRGSRAQRALSMIEDATRGQQLTESQARFIAQTVVGGASGLAPVASREATQRLSIR